MVSDLNAKYLQCMVALNFVDRYVNSIEGALAAMVPTLPELAVMDEFCDTGEALDFFRDNLNILREKFEGKLSKTKKSFAAPGTAKEPA